MPGKKFDIDDIVYAKWPGSTQYYKAVILDIDSGRYQVKFDSDDTIDVVQRKHLMVRTSSILLFFLHYGYRAFANHES